MSEISIDNLKSDPYDQKLLKLKYLKNELIGCQEKKELYFDKGVIEILLPLVGSEQDEILLQEIITIINSYFFEFPRALDCFRIFSHSFVQMHFLLQTNKNGSPQLIDMILRVIKNSLISGIVKVSDFENQNIIQELEPLMNNKYRVSLIAKLVSLLCQSEHFRIEVSKTPKILLTIMEYITRHSLTISDECLENCLSALADTTKGNKDNCFVAYHYEGLIEHMAKYLRHPERIIKIQSAKILTNINRYHRLSADQQQAFRWIIMQMITLLPLSASNLSQITEICDIIQAIASDCKGRKHLQKAAGDIQAIEKICDLLIALKSKEYQPDEQFDVEMSDGHFTCEMIQTQANLIQALAALTSQEESCRKKVAENKKILEELLSAIKSNNREVKLSACLCFVSLSRSDKMIKSIVLDSGNFIKELHQILLQSDSDPPLQLNACKALCNIAIDFQKNLAKEESLVKKLVSLTYIDNVEIKTAACFSLKNLIFRCAKDVRTQVLKELSIQHLLTLLDDPHTKIKEQALMIYRNLLYNTESDIQQVIHESGEPFLKRIEQFLNEGENSTEGQAVIVQTLYVLSCLASGNQKHKKIALEDRFFSRALQLLKSTSSSAIKIAVFNLILNLCYKEEGATDTKARKQIVEMNLNDMLMEMKERERDPEVRGFIDRTIKKILSV